MNQLSKSCLIEVFFKYLLDVLTIIPRYIIITNSEFWFPIFCFPNTIQRNYAQGEFVAEQSYPAAGCAPVSTNKNVQLVCSRKPNKKKWPNQEGK